MIQVSRGQSVQFKFIFVSEGDIYDPTLQDPPIDIVFSIIRGDYGTGPVVDGPYSFNNQNPESNISIEKNNSYEFVFNYVIPQNLFEGSYSVLARTQDVFGPVAISSGFQIKNQPITLSPIVISAEKSAITNYLVSYEELSGGNTSTILLIGHADGMDLNSPIRIRSVQSAIDILRADLNSPLLRAVFDCYAAGARDIIICASAPMVEYVSSYSDRLTSTTLFDLSSATPSSKNFYEKYYERLEETYRLIKDLDFVDIIVPLETSIIQTGEIDFITQLAEYCGDFHNSTGYVQIGVIGSRSGGLSGSNIEELENNEVLINKLTEYNFGGTISSDDGRFVVPVYGEAVFQHSQLKTSYVSNMAASIAGMIASTPLDRAMIRARIPGAMFVYGADLTQAEFRRLESIGVNTIYRGKKTRRSVPFEVYITNEYTLAKSNSTLSRANQMRLVAAVVNQVREYSYEAIGKFGYDIVVDKVRSYLLSLKDDKIIVDFSLNIEVNPTIVGSLILYIELLSSLGLRKVDFTIATGPGA
jgi:hypothetical protein